MHPEGQLGEVFSKSTRKVTSCSVGRGVVGDNTKITTFLLLRGWGGALTKGLGCHMVVGSGAVVGAGGGHGEWGGWRAAGVDF